MTEGGKQEGIVTHPPWFLYVTAYLNDCFNTPKFVLQIGSGT